MSNILTLKANRFAFLTPKICSINKYKNPKSLKLPILTKNIIQSIVTVKVTMFNNNWSNNKLQNKTENLVVKNIKFIDINKRNFYNYANKGPNNNDNDDNDNDDNDDVDSEFNASETRKRYVWLNEKIMLVNCIIASSILLTSIAYTTKYGYSNDMLYVLANMLLLTVNLKLVFVHGQTNIVKSLVLNILIFIFLIVWIIYCQQKDYNIKG